MIRYDAKLNKQLVRTVRNFNAKVSRLEKQGIASPVEKISLRELKQDFTDRRMLISYMRELRKFSRRGIERIVYEDRYGNRFTDYEFKVGRSRQLRAIRKAESLLDKSSSTHRTLGGEKIPQSIMGTDYVNNLEANLSRLKGRKFTQTLTQAQKATLARASKKIIGTEKYQFQLLSNFEQELSILANWADVPESTVNTIISGLSQLDGETFERARSTEELIVKIEEYYPRLKEVSTNAEKQAVGAMVRPFIIELESTLPVILQEYYQQQQDFVANV